MKKSDEVMMGLIEEQIANVRNLSEEIAELSGEEISPVLILDALACAGLQLLPIAGENVPSLAMFYMLKNAVQE